jgi:hypothetical protein
VVAASSLGSCLVFVSSAVVTSRSRRLAETCACRRSTCSG